MTQKSGSLTGMEPPPDAAQSSQKSKPETWMNYWSPNAGQLRSEAPGGCHGGGGSAPTFLLTFPLGVPPGSRKVGGWGEPRERPPSPPHCL